MDCSNKFEVAVTTLLPGDEREWSCTLLDLLSLAATVDRLAEDLTVVSRRLVRSIDEINEAVGRNTSYISPLQGNHVMEFSETLAKFSAFRESLYVMIGAVLGPEAKNKFVSDLV